MAINQRISHVEAVLSKPIKLVRWRTSGCLTAVTVLSPSSGGNMEELTVKAGYAGDAGPVLKSTDCLVSMLIYVN